MYDGWNMICEITRPGIGEEKTSYYVWGLDPSGTEQGAGGVGGLIARLDDVLAPFEYDIYYCFYSGNGNVSQLVDAESGEIAAHYDYDPFGNVVCSFGDLAEENPYRFSTKYHDDGTGLVYYGYRYYSAESGRWLNRDPFGEEGGINLYAMILNDPVNLFDPYGLMELAERTKESKTEWESNCLGYAMTGRIGQFRYPDASKDVNNNLSFVDLLGKENWECQFKNINSYKDCDCGSNKDQMLIVHEIRIETEKKPWTDPEFPWNPKGPDALHAIRLETETVGYREVPERYDGVAMHHTVPQKKLTTLFTGKLPLLCCCKAKNMACED